MGKKKIRRLENGQSWSSTMADERIEKVRWIKICGYFCGNLWIFLGEALNLVPLFD